MKKIILNKYIITFTMLLIWLKALIIMSCAPGYWKPRISYAERQKVLQESIVKIQEIERSNQTPQLIQFLQIIYFYLGTPYQSGGNSRSGMDCSGLVATVFNKSFNLDLPHNAYQMYQKCQQLAAEELMPGDLVFFHTSSRNKINHVGIYLGKNYFAHASQIYGVIVSDLTDDYYRTRYVSAGRILISTQ